MAYYAVVVSREGKRQVVGLVEASSLPEASRRIGVEDASPAPAWLERLDPTTKGATLFLQSVPLLRSAEDFRRCFDK